MASQILEDSCCEVSFGIGYFKLSTSVVQAAFKTFKRKETKTKKLL